LLNNTHEVHNIGGGIGESVATSLLKALQPPENQENGEGTPATQQSTHFRDLLLKFKAAGNSLVSKI
jgi:hypothetical protein